MNVARALSLAGLDTIAVLPAAAGDPFLTALAATGVAVAPVAVAGAVRTNLAITESDGTTTKLNEPGAQLDGAALSALTEAILARAATASWVVLSGSLPPGVPVGWYADIVALLRDFPCQVAVDTSDAPLSALAAGFDRAAPDLIKPNSEELAGLAGVTAEALEASVAQGDPEPVVSRRTRSAAPRRRHRAGHPGCRGRRPGQRHRSLAGHSPADHSQEHRRRRRLVAGRLRARRRRWGRAAPPPPDGGRLRQRCRGATRFGAARTRSH